MLTRTGFMIGLSVLLISGCATMGQRVEQHIIGQWRTSVGGYPVIVKYTPSTVQVDDARPVSYRLLGDRLILPQGGSQSRIVSFPSATEMVQTDPLTGGQQHYTRIRGPG